jgi:hypothetical protein
MAEQREAIEYSGLEPAKTGRGRSFAIRRPVVLLLPAAAGALLAACAFAYVLSQIPARLEDPSSRLIAELGLWRWARDHLPVPESGGSIAAVVLGFAALGFVSYALAIRAVWNTRATPRRVAAVAGTAALLMTVSVLMMPTGQSDIYDYIGYGRVQAVYDGNPYKTPPPEFRDDPSYEFANPKYRDRPDNKLPTWQLVSRGLASTGIDSPVGNLFFYRSVLAALGLASLALIWLAVGEIAPGARLASLVVWGWNPVVVFYAPGKTDTLMAFLFLVAAVLFVRRRRVLASVPFALSIFVKLLTLPLFVATWLADLVSRRWRVLVLETLVLACVTVAVYAPFGGPHLLGEHVGLFGGHARDTRTGAPPSATPAISGVPRPVLAIALLVVIGIALAWRRRELSELAIVRIWAPVALVAAVILVDPNSAWYLMTLIAVTSLAQPALVVGATWLLTFGAFAFSLWQSSSTKAHPLPDLIDAPRIATYAVPLALAGLAAFLYFRRRRRASAG